MQSIDLSKKVINLYYEAVEGSFEGDYSKMQIFKEWYPVEYKKLYVIHRKRTELRNCVKAMRVVSDEIYFGTLTFNSKKDSNKITTKRREAFMKLNTLFEYVVLVEEFGTEKGRYHIHFLGAFRSGVGFKDFTSTWRHSRQELRKVQSTDGVVRYLCPYLVKQTPRLRKNKHLIALVKEYKSSKHMSQLFPNEKLFDVQMNCTKVHLVNAFDEL